MNTIKINAPYKESFLNLYNSESIQVFRERENQTTQIRTSQSRVENQQTQPTYDTANSTLVEKTWNCPGLSVLDPFALTEALSKFVQTGRLS